MLKKMLLIQLASLVGGFIIGWLACLLNEEVNGALIEAGYVRVPYTPFWRKP